MITVLRKLLLFLLLAAVLSCNCDHRALTIHKVQPNPIINESPSLLRPAVPQRLVEYNVVVYNLNRANCGGTVVSASSSGIFVLTAAHCVINRQDQTIMPYGFISFNGDDKYRVTAIAVSRKNDLALLMTTDTTPLKLVAPLASSPPKVGDFVWIIGYGARVEDIVSHGTVAKENVASYHNTETRWLLVNGSIYYGNSGGGVFNSKGELVGVIVENGPQHPVWGLWASAVHLDTVRQFLDHYLP